MISLLCTSSHRRRHRPHALLFPLTGNRNMLTPAYYPLTAFPWRRRTRHGRSGHGTLAVIQTVAALSMSNSRKILFRGC